MLEHIGRYRVERMLGTGAFATVWLANDDALAAQVAVKVLAENWAHDEDIRRRFAEEARILWRLDSDHIVRVHTVDQLDDGRPYFVMDFAGGGSLDERIRERRDQGRPFTVDEALTLSMAIADGLADAHHQGIVHRDLKPSNVLFRVMPSGQERLLLADFGIARSLEAARGATTISAGTPHYMAPEQAQGHAERPSDIYASAVILHELLVGSPPFPFDSAGQVLRAQLTGPPPDVRTLRPDVPAAVAAVVARGLSMEPADRAADADAWRAELVAAAQAPSPAETIGPTAPVPSQGETLGPGDIPPAASVTPPPTPPPVSPPMPPPVSPPVPPLVPPAPPVGGGDDDSRRRRRALILIGAVVAIAALIVAVGVFKGGKASAGEIILAPKDAAGANPFTPSVVPAAATTPAFTPPTVPAQQKGATGSISGSTAGLYGGTRQLAVCDPGQLVTFLQANPAKAKAWAAVFGITADRIPAYVAGLTPVVLRTDTRVTNHGFVNGVANPIQSVLQAGTAVLVDNYGVPRVKCFCGNPLSPPVPVSSTPTYTGPPWPGFAAPQIIVIAPTVTIQTIVIVDLATGVPFARPVGTTGSQDTDAPPGALFGQPKANGIPVGAPVPPSEVPGSYLLGPATASGSSCGQGGGDQAGKTLDFALNGNTLTMSGNGQSQSVPFDPATSSFSETQTDNSSSLNFGTSSFAGQFVRATGGGVELKMSLLILHCTLRFSGIKGAHASAPATTAPPAQPVDISREGTVSASSTYSGQYAASRGIDGSTGTSWFSAGASDGPTSTYSWAGARDDTITSITIIGNAANSDPNVRHHFGYTHVEIQVFNGAGAVVYDQSFPGPSDAAGTVQANPNVAGRRIVLTLSGREDPSCGGFSELRVTAAR